tara:strand:- start:18 stop:716 length:699 start_codon:yes stop_codon:yes gene_type:complete
MAMLINLPRHRIELFLIVAAILLTLLGTAMEVSYYLLDHKRLLGALRQLSLSEEANIPTWYSAMLLASSAVCLAAIAFVQPHGAGHYRRHWFILALIFLYMSLDETAVIHEMAIDPVREAFDLGGALYFAWTLPAALFMAIFLLSYLGFLRHLSPSSRNRFILAGLVYVVGAFGTEFVIGYWWETYGDDFTNGMLNVTQESMEIVGVSLFLSALLRHLAAMGGELRIVLVER